MGDSYGHIAGHARIDLKSGLAVFAVIGFGGKSDDGLASAACGFDGKPFLRIGRNAHIPSLRCGDLHLSLSAALGEFYDILVNRDTKNGFFLLACHEQ